jgi:hypothetical protein
MAAGAKARRTPSKTARHAKAEAAFGTSNARVEFELTPSDPGRWRHVAADPDQALARMALATSATSAGIMSSAFGAPPLSIWRSSVASVELDGTQGAEERFGGELALSGRLKLDRRVLEQTPGAPAPSARTDASLQALRTPANPHR